MIDRPDALAAIRSSFAAHPAVGLAGPRQCGKTTLARILAAEEKDCTFFDLEKAVDRRRLETPEQALGSLAARRTEKSGFGPSPRPARQL
jgi:predicted AAA+ superfamily ATPase